MHPLDDTIAAIASPPGGAARGIDPPQRAGAAGLPGRLLPPGALRCISRRSRGRRRFPACCWLPGVAAPLPGELYLWPGKRSYTGPAGGRNPYARLAAVAGGPAADRLRRRGAAGGARRIHPPRLPGRTDRPDAGRGRARGRRRRRRPATARRLGPACRRPGPAAPSAARGAVGPVGRLGGPAWISPRKTCRRLAPGELSPRLDEAADDDRRPGRPNGRPAGDSRGGPRRAGRAAQRRQEQPLQRLGLPGQGVGFRPARHHPRLPRRRSRFRRRALPIDRHGGNPGRGFSAGQHRAARPRPPRASNTARPTCGFSASTRRSPGPQGTVRFSGRDAERRPENGTVPLG